MTITVIARFSRTMTEVYVVQVVCGLMCWVRIEDIDGIHEKIKQYQFFNNKLK